MSLCLQAGGLSAQRTLRVGFLPPAWRPRMTLMTSPSPGMKVREVFGAFFINSKLLQKKTLALVFVAGSAAKYQVTDDSMDINIKILLKCHKYSFCAAAQVHKSPLDGAKYTHSLLVICKKYNLCYLLTPDFITWWIFFRGCDWLTGQPVCSNVSGRKVSDRRNHLLNLHLVPVTLSLTTHHTPTPR